MTTEKQIDTRLKLTAHERRLIAVVAAVGEVSVRHYLSGAAVQPMQRVRIEAAIAALTERGALPADLIRSGEASR